MDAFLAGNVIPASPSPISDTHIAHNVADVIAALDTAVEANKAMPRFAQHAVDRVAICAMIKGAILHNIDDTPAAIACLEWIVKNDKKIVRERSAGVLVWRPHP